MNALRRHSLLLIALVAVLALFSTVQAVVVAQSATPEATAVSYDLQPMLEDYLTNLPSDFYGIRPDMAEVQLTQDPKPFLLDVREASEVESGGYIPGAVLIPLRTLTQNLDKLPAQDQPILVYCGIGHRGAIATEILHLLGYTNVKSIFGGFSAWKAAGLPVATGEAGAPVVSGAPAPTYDPALFAALDQFVSTLPQGFYATSPTVALRSLGEQPKPFVLDVRETTELTQNGYIDGAVNVPIRTLLDNLNVLPADKSQPILVYCAIGHRGAMAMTTLQLLGYSNVTSIAGGFNGWVGAGLPIVPPASS